MVEITRPFLGSNTMQELSSKVTNSAKGSLVFLSWNRVKQCPSLLRKVEKL